MSCDDETVWDQVMREAFGLEPGDPPSAAVLSGDASNADGRHCGRYRVLGEIARGGAGVVLHGRDVDLGREVAIKVLQNDLQDAGVLARFVEEAQIGGRLQHPGIVPVYEMGLDAAGRPFFAMKLVHGRTLQEWWRVDAPTRRPSRWLDVFERVCQTVAYAHSRRVVHRDLKPSNIMVGEFGEVLVMDWGMAKAGEDDWATEGDVVGTPAYMPPEQARGEVGRVDARSDVFALGAILCELLTGDPPYGASARAALLEDASRARLDSMYRRLDACAAEHELVELVRRCCAEDPEDRPADAAALVDAIVSYRARVERRAEADRVALQTAAVRARAAKKLRVLRVWLSVAALIVVGFVVTIGARAVAAAERERSDRQAQLVAELQEVMTRAVVAELDAEPDYGRVFAAFGIDIGELSTDEIAARLRDGGELLRITAARAFDNWAVRTVADSSQRRRLIEIAMAVDDDPWRASLRQASLRGDVGRLVQCAGELAEALRDWPSLDLLGTSLFDAGELQLAQRTLRRGVEAHPGAFWLRVHLAKVLSGVFQLPGRPRARPADDDLAEAVLHARISVALQPSSPFARRFLARVLQARGQFEEAVRRYGEAIAMHPESLHARTGLVGLLIEIERYSDAGAALDALVSLHPGNRFVRFLVRRLRGLDPNYGEDPDRTIAASQAQIERGERLADAYEDLADAYFLCAEFEAALDAADRCLTVDAGRGAAAGRRAHCLVELGRYDQARDAIAAARSFAGQSLAMRKLLRQIEVWERALQRSGPERGRDPRRIVERCALAEACMHRMEFARARALLRPIVDRLGPTGAGSSRILAERSRRMLRVAACAFVLTPAGAPTREQDRLVAQDLFDRLIALPVDTGHGQRVLAAVGREVRAARYDRRLAPLRE